MKQLFVVLLAALVITGCNANNEEPTTSTASASIEGTWKRPIIGSTDEFEGLSFSPDGHYGFINIASMSAAGWKQNGQQLELSSLTERYPQPETSSLKIETLTNKALVLSGEDYSSGKYIRDDDFAGLISGELSFKTEQNLPTDAVLILQLNDVSLADAPSQLVATQIAPVAGNKSPIAWRVYYPTAGIDTRNRYSISANIVYDNHVQFRTTSNYAVLTPGQTNTVNIEVDAMPAKAEPTGETLQGMYNYMADTALFTNCADGKSYPVVMDGDNANVERAYLELKAGDNAKVWIEVTGNLVEQTGVEGNITETALLVEKLMNIDAEKSCAPGPPDFGLAGKKWQLFAVPGNDLPEAVELAHAYLEFSVEGAASGSNGCNRVNSGYKLNDYEITIGPMMSTRRACPGELGVLERVFMEAINDIDSYELKADLLSLMIDGEPALQFKVASNIVAENTQAASVGIVGKWQLVQLSGITVADDIKLENEVYLDFSDTDKVSGKTGCNQYNSSYTQSGQQLKFGMRMSTMMACSPDLMQLEVGVQQALTKTVAFNSDTKVLVLNDAKGAILAEFQRTE